MPIALEHLEMPIAWNIWKCPLHGTSVNAHCMETFGDAIDFIDTFPQNEVLLPCNLDSVFNQLKLTTVS